MLCFKLFLCALKESVIFILKNIIFWSIFMRVLWAGLGTLYTPAIRSRSLTDPAVVRCFGTAGQAGVSVLWGNSCLYFLVYLISLIVSFVRLSFSQIDYNEKCYGYTFLLVLFIQQVHEIYLIFSHFLSIAIPKY